MKHFRLFLFIYAGFFISTILIFYFGDEGIQAYGNLLGYKGELEKNLAELEQINRELNDQLQLLKSNPDVNRVEARNLNLIGKDEKLVKITGYSRSGRFYEIGKLLRWTVPKKGRSIVFKYIGAFTPLILFLLFGLMGLVNRKRHNGN